MNRMKSEILVAIEILTDETLPRPRVAKHLRLRSTPTVPRTLNNTLTTLFTTVKAADTKTRVENRSA